jgi:hypothetical protein
MRSITSVASDTYCLRLEREFKATHRRRLPHLVANAVGQGTEKVVIDCASWTTLDLMLLSSLLTCAAVCDDAGVQFELHNVADGLHRRIEALGLGSRLKLADVPQPAS